MVKNRVAEELEPLRQPNVKSLTAQVHQHFSPKGRGINLFTAMKKLISLMGLTLALSFVPSSKVLADEPTVTKPIVMVVMLEDGTCLPFDHLLTDDEIAEIYDNYYNTKVEKP